MEQRFLGIIPARYASSRFPGKPLADLAGKPMIQWVWERASHSFPDLVVATDDRRILEAVRSFGGKAVMTSAGHGSGTERCAEALDLVEKEGEIPFSHVVNIQGDEPLVSPAQLEELKSCFSEAGVDIATLVHLIQSEEELQNPHVVKVVLDRSMRALYFSRASIPFSRDHVPDLKRREGPYYRHIGLYAFRSSVLRQVVNLPPADLEQAESLEQLRWLYHGLSIQTRLTRVQSMGVDTPEDLDVLRKQLPYS